LLVARRCGLWRHEPNSPAVAPARVAYLGPSGPTILDPRQIEQFKVGLVENDLIVGKNVTVEYFWAEGSLDRLKDLATELGGRDFDVIVTVESSRSAF
jgi:hypothetical protein